MSKHKLALLGGDPVLSKPLRPFNAVGVLEREALLKLLEDPKPLSGFFGSARPEFFGGPEVRAFEEEWCARFNVNHAVSVNSATSGLMVAMGAIGISPGDEVIVPPYTMSATAMAPLVYGGIPVFADVDPHYFCIDPIAVKKQINSKTKAIIATNLFGHPADLHTLRKIAQDHNLFFIEDNAQAVLAKDQDCLAGTVGHIGIYSLNVHKHIQTGEGGICVTNDVELARRMQLIRNHGENAVEWLEIKDITNLIGYNFRMLEMTAALGRVQLKRLDELVDRAETIGKTLTQGLNALVGITPPSVRQGCRHNYFLWSARFEEEKIGILRSLFHKALQAEGVPVLQGYVKPLYLLPLFQQKIAMGRNGFPFTETTRDYPAGLCPVTEDLHYNRLLQIQPVSWDLDQNTLDLITEAFYKVHANVSELKSITSYA